MSDEVLVGAPVEQARQRLFAQVRLDGLQSAVAGAFTDGTGNSGDDAPEQHNQAPTVQTLPGYRSGPITVVPLRWYVRSTSGERFPAVDANLELQQARPGTSRLALTGIYRSATGEFVTTAQQDDARATVRQFLGRLARIPGRPVAGLTRRSTRPRGHSDCLGRPSGRSALPPAALLALSLPTDAVLGAVVKTRRS